MPLCSCETLRVSRRKSSRCFSPAASNRCTASAFARGAFIQTAPSFFDRTFDLAQVLAKRHRGIARALREERSKLQLFAQRLAFADRCGLSPFCLRDALRHLDQLRDARVRHKQAA